MRPKPAAAMVELRRKERRDNAVRVFFCVILSLAGMLFFEERTTDSACLLPAFDGNLKEP
jgi:hypothetical protein